MWHVLQGPIDRRMLSKKSAVTTCVLEVWPSSMFVLFFSHSFFGKPKWHGIVTRSQMYVVEYGDLCVRHMRDYAIPL